MPGKIRITDEEPDDLRVGGLQAQRLYFGEVKVWDYETSAGRATVFPPRVLLNILKRVPGRSVLPILTRKLIYVIPRVPTVDARRRVTVSVPRVSLVLQTRIPDVVDLRAAAIYPPKVAISITKRLPTVDPRRQVSIAAPRTLLNLTARTPSVAVLYSVNLNVPKVTITTIPRIPTVDPRRSVTISVPRVSLVLQTRIPDVIDLQAASIYPPKAALSLLPRVPTVVTAIPATRQRINLTAFQLIPGSTWTKLTGWAADATYPGATIINDSIVMQYAAPITVRAHAVRDTGTFETRVRIVVNGVAQPEVSVSDISATATYSYTSVVGDIIHMEVYSTRSNTYREFDVGTYLEVQP